MKKASGKSNIDIVKDYLTGNRPFTQVGYEPPKEEKHKDGDVWTDKDGITWIQNGSCKISKKLYDTIEATRQICQVCKKDILWSSDPNDSKFFNKTGKCYDCIINEEHKMRIDGTYEFYEKIKVIQNQKGFLTELKQKIEESLTWLCNKSNKVEYVNGDGTFEKWTDISRDDFIKNAEKDLEEVKKSLILCEESIKMLEEQLNEHKAKSTTKS